MSVTPLSSATASAATLAASGRDQALRNLPQAEQVKAAAGQFEAIILRELLSDTVGKLTGGENAGGGGMYGFMLTDVLANQLSAGGGLGISKILQQQLTPRTSREVAAGIESTP
jgi:Rod binding domain-containing protein